VGDTGCDWLSVAVGNVHGAISGVFKNQKKVEARLDLAQLARLRDATGVPLVLHGGSGIRQEYVRQAVAAGIAKINVGTEIRQAFEQKLNETGSVPAAQENVYRRTAWLIGEYYGWSGTRQTILGGVAATAEERA
jgi:fructose/tagatose bisphosphate aldolase